MMKKALTLSIVIPAYNEESHLELCLNSIVNQTEAPDEVIVVDNNSTDNTVAIAKSYNFVKVITEKEQGLIPARNTGFEFAKGDVYGRINADAILDENWVKNVKTIFTDPDVVGASGPASALVLPGLHKIHSKLWSKIYLASSRSYFRANIMWGANMAIRASVWPKIKDKADLEDSYVHEDQDLSMLLATFNKKVIISDNITFFTDEQSYFHWPKFKEYMVRQVRTKRHHIQIGTYAKVRKNSFLKSWLILVLFFLPVAVFGLTSVSAYWLPRLFSSRSAKFF